MKRTLILPLILGSCQWIPGTDAHAIREAEKVVAAKLSDPGSAQFRNEKVVQADGKPAVCGEVNGHNQFGAYAGFVPFAYFTDIKKPLIAADGQRPAICAMGPVSRAPAAAE